MADAMTMNRRSFLQASAFAPAALAAGNTDFAAPAYEAPLFDLHKFSKTPIKIKSIELLHAGKHFFVRSTSADGVVGISKTKQIEDYTPVFVRRVASDITKVSEKQTRKAQLASQKF